MGCASCASLAAEAEAEAEALRGSDAPTARFAFGEKDAFQEPVECQC